jgi:DNA-binding NarL/FixJ family response regulator
MLASRGLSAREIDVARLLALGHTNIEIAASLYLSARTIEHHRANVFRKLGVHSRAALVHKMNERPVPEAD